MMMTNFMPVDQLNEKKPRSDSQTTGKINQFSSGVTTAAASLSLVSLTLGRQGK
jgi:hypothetical protein